ncbi:uncharacterized protein LOC115599680 [Calypte anna]|uniref:uncharacterized protein LOC115599680 n=1 Tax=Calypte anna TaxID=9244 RepID=UPI0011C48AA0|nr:uncharacterized protein LOC115599680 [Calypte anna]
MGTRGMVTAWLCIVLLQAGDGFVFEDYEPAYHLITHNYEAVESMGDQRTTKKLLTPPKATSSSPWTGNSMTTRGGAGGNSTDTSLDVHFRYWAPALFVTIALLMLLISYHRTKGKETEDEATSASHTSESGALRIPIPEEESEIPSDSKSPKIPPSDLDPNSPQPDGDSSSSDPECYETAPVSRRASWWWNSPEAKLGST